MRSAKKRAADAKIQLKLEQAAERKSKITQQRSARVRN
jgi:hypothetical protein